MPCCLSFQIGFGRNARARRNLGVRDPISSHSLRSIPRAARLGALPMAPDALELERHRPYLLRFALLQLRERSAADDAVQETLLAAIQGASRFAGQSSVRTWLVGILKHKIVDSLRKTSREQPIESLEDRG